MSDGEADASGHQDRESDALTFLHTRGLQRGDEAAHVVRGRARAGRIGHAGRAPRPSGRGPGGRPAPAARALVHEGSTGRGTDRRRQPPPERPRALPRYRPRAGAPPSARARSAADRSCAGSSSRPRRPGAVGARPPRRRSRRSTAMVATAQDRRDDQRRTGWPRPSASRGPGRRARSRGREQGRQRIQGGAGQVHQVVGPFGVRQRAHDALLLASRAAAARGRQDAWGTRPEAADAAASVIPRPRAARSPGPRISRMAASRSPPSCRRRRSK